MSLLALSTVTAASIFASRWYHFKLTLVGSWGMTILSLRAGMLEGGHQSDFLSHRSGLPPIAIDVSKLQFPFGPQLSASHVLSANMLSQFGIEVRGSCWLGRYYRSDSEYGFEAVAWLLPIVVISVACVPLWSVHRVRARQLAGHCAICNYDRNSSAASNPCPECGHVPPSPHAASARGEVPEGR